MLEWIAIVTLAAGPATAPTVPEPPKPPTISLPTAPKIAMPAASDAGAAASAKGSADAGTATLTAAKEEEAVDPAETTSKTPPSLTHKALCAELSSRSSERNSVLKRIEDERKALAADKAELERQSAEIAKQRVALREETARLDSLIEHAPSGSAAPTTKAATAAASPKVTGDLETLAKTMKSMKPEQAAALVARMDHDLGARLLAKMKPADAGAVLEHVKPDLAAELVANMATLPVTKAKGARL